MADEQKHHNKLTKTISYLVTFKELLVAIIAIATSIYTLVKPQDTKVTQKSYEILVNRTNELAKASENNHDDIASLRSFMDGFIKAGGLKAEVQAEPSSAPIVPLKSKKAAIVAAEPVRVNPRENYSDSSASLPNISPKAAAAVPPPFAQVIVEAAK